MDFYGATKRSTVITSIHRKTPGIHTLLLLFDLCITRCVVVSVICAEVWGWRGCGSASCWL